MLARFQAWYGWFVVCLTCGERWEDGEPVERPFERGWRHASMAEALAWLDATIKHGDRQLP